ncbi:Pentatricopeptide repeat-containing protein -chloroplastic [Striga hermonthica]|uniref:Pentatricopeptide repeat-containing protein -chloroplastic n=1 Tax=Striga hermonthica TaxID=68872 RepID=A0A9N7R659_STRHE|nr:Pentatricopeptide repeat-containing protein -chloroplastic [Striga hermonthica]
MMGCPSSRTINLPPARNPNTNTTPTPTEALKFLQKCTTLPQTKLAHAKIVRNGLHQHQLIAASLIRLYSSCGCLDYAASVFQLFDNPTTFIWNLIIRAHTVNGQPAQAIVLYNSMICSGVGADKFTLPFVMKACLACSLVDKAREVYGLAVRTGLSEDIYLGNVLLDLYFKSGLLYDGLRMFDKMRAKNVVSWTTVIAGLVRNGRIDVAQRFFNKMPAKNVVSWSSMIHGYSKRENPGRALEVFVEAQSNNVRPNEYMLVGVLTACAELGSLRFGGSVHGFAVRNGFESGVFLGTALVDMYSKCGSLGRARRVFGNMDAKSVATWNVMISSFGVHGFHKEAVACFEMMEKMGVKPDAVTFAGLISACLKMESLERGREYFYCMLNRYEVKPSFEHYVLIDELPGG